MKNQTKRIWCYSILLIFLFAFCSTAFANEKNEAKAPRIPLQDFFRNPEIAGYQISPNGKNFAFLKPDNHRMNVFVQEEGQTEAKRITNAVDRDIYHYFWKNDQTIIYQQDSGGDENFHLYAVNIQTGENRDLTPFSGVRAEVLDILPDKDNELLLVMNQRSRETFDVYRLDLTDGKLTLEVENPGNYTDYLTDNQGTVRLAFGKDADTGNNLVYYRAAADQPFAQILSLDYRENVTPYFFSGDDKKIYIGSSLGRDKQALVLFDPEQAKEEKVLFEHPEVDVAGAGMSQKRKVLIGVGYVTDKLHRQFFDDQTRQVYEALAGHLGSDEISVTSWDKEEDKCIVLVRSDRNRGTYYFYDIATDTLTKLGDTAPWMKEKDLAVMQPVQYTSRDGYTIHGYLTLPQGRSAKNLPVVINPHGGPWARDFWGYAPDVQFLANRGYAVLQMNFRGSTGYGKAFLNAGNKQWGKKMQDDITDGAEWLISQGIADPKRVTIYGGSYGGYAVLAGLTFTPDVYACGVDLVGPSNLFTLLKTIPPYWKTAITEFYERMGNPEQDTQLLRDVSPVFHADQIKAPLFVAQGANDPRVNINESNQIVDALRARGIPVEYMVKENEGHGFHNEENRMDFYQAMEKFLAKYLKPAA
ncbi:MAG: S9 family peptidase [Veillonellales bacterium]